MSSKRQRQMSELLKREISRIIRHELDIKDSKLVSVTHVEVTPDFKMATVHVSHIKDDPEVRDNTIKLLKRNEKEIRWNITQNLDIKEAPNLRFREDTSIKDAAHLTDIMKDLQP
ncbi:MAG: 30S ribosome-binding factor RbfA [bacterium]